MRNFALLIAGLLILSACNMAGLQKKTSGWFTGQYFKTSISLTELYKIRYGHYPISLDSLTYMGDWDKMISGFVEYNRLDTDCQLDIVPGLFNTEIPDLSFPVDFWQGLGVRRSNVRKSR